MKIKTQQSHILAQFSFVKLAIGCIILLCVLFSCKKESFIKSGSASLSTSIDTLKFDTVFTTTGSVTQSFKIFNGNDQKLLLSHVRLAGGNTSYFKLNVDGTPGQEINNIELLPNDSAYVFVQVKINPTSADLPFVIRDSISISYNGNIKYIQLEAFGQNARFYRNLVLRGSSAWASDLPIVILGGLLVDTTATLTIRKGTRIYLHPDAPLIVNGTLIVQGTKDEKVIFASDRIDPFYRDLPAGWPGIYFTGSSKNNKIDFAIIKNAYQGIVSQEGTTNGLPKVVLSHSIIDNIYDAGLFGINSSIEADNCLISNCGKNISLVLGGNYSFTHCTVATYGNFFVDHNFPVLLATNFIEQNSTVYTGDLKASFTNCIFWGEGGTIENEIILGKKPNALFDVTFENMVYKNKDADFSPAILTGNNFENTDPKFDSINVTKNYYDFHITKDINSPAIDQGSPTPYPTDLDEKNRNVLPDLGCYEK